MVKLLFVCHGNICRSPMAKFVMKDLVKKAGLEAQFQIDSAATSREEIGNPVYPPARRKLAEHGISCDGHAARQLTNQDYDAYDLLIGMDKANLRNMHRITYANEADVLNVALFGMTAKEWRQSHPSAKGNIRDEASLQQLIVLANMESINAELIRQGISQAERLLRLNESAKQMMKSLVGDYRIETFEKNALPSKPNAENSSK